MSDCKGCGRRVVWMKNVTTGQLAPVDPAPVPTGNVVMATPETYRVLTKDEMAGPDTSDRYTLHFATCPVAGRFRRCRRCHRSPCTCR